MRRPLNDWPLSCATRGCGVASSIGGEKGLLTGEDDELS